MSEVLDSSQDLQKGFFLEIKKSETDGDIRVIGDFYRLREWQVDAFETLKDSQLMILNAPMGSGKSFLMCALSAYKLSKNFNLKCIIAVPQTIISSGFINEKIQLPDGQLIHWFPQHDLCNSKSSRSLVNYIIEWLRSPKINFSDRILVCTHSILVKMFCRLDHEDRVKLLSDTLLYIDEAHHIAISEDRLYNRLGEVASFFINKLQVSSLIGLTTATYFRGDRTTILPEKLKEKFRQYDLPYDRYMSSMKYLKSFKYDFLLSGPNYINGLKKVLETSERCKDIIYIPPVISNHSTGDKHKEVDDIIRIYKELYGSQMENPSSPLCFLEGDSGYFKILDLVTEDRRIDKKSFITSETMKQREALDAIVALGMFQEGANWIYANRCFIIGKRSSLLNIVQMVGRVLRDVEGKEHVDVIHILPFILDQKHEDFKENLNDFIKAILSSLILEDVLAPIEIKVPKIENSNKDKPNVNTNKHIDPLCKLIPDESLRQSIMEKGFECLLKLDSPSLENFKEKMTELLKEDDLEDHVKDVVADTIWFLNMRRSLSLQGIDIENVDFDLVKLTHPLDYMLRYTTDTCGIDTLRKLRVVIQDGLDQAWEKAFVLLKNHFESTNNSSISKELIIDGVNLMNWATVQRKAFKNGTMSKERQLKLESLPFWYWDYSETREQQTLDAIKSFASREKHIRVPFNHTENGFPLGRVMMEIRSSSNSNEDF